MKEKTIEECRASIQEFANKYSNEWDDIQGWIKSERLSEDILSDLTALLEQHKEMMLRDELEKFGTYFNEIRCPYVVTSVIDEYLKNVKK